MPEIPPHDIIATRQDRVGHFAVFHRPSPCLTAPVPWRAVALDQGGDTVTIPVRLDESDDPGVPAWTARDILRVILGRQLAEVLRSAHAMAHRCASQLTRALITLQRRPGLPPAPPITVSPGLHASVYPWTVARLPGVSSLVLCPGPCGDGEGVTPELLLHVLDQLLADAARGIRTDPHLLAASGMAAAALREEAGRMRAVCGPARSH